jgi:hypothetical protein
VSIADLFDVLKDRAFGALMLIFAAPNIFPLPPGSSAILGAPLIYLSAQLALSRPEPWLPKFMAARSISRADFATMVQKVSPWLIKAEKLLKPRLSFLTRPPFEQLIGVICLGLAVILFLPIPLGNMPPAVAICLFSLSILERDGIAAILGVISSIVAVVIAWTVLYALIKSAVFILRNALAI